MNNKAKGYILAAFSAATYGMNPLFSLPLYADGMGVDSVLFFRYLFAVPMVALMVKSRGRSFAIQKGELWPLLMVGVFFVLSSITLFRSYLYMDSGIASTILFIYPVMVALIMAIFFKEKVSLQTWVCIAMALAGIGLLYKAPDGATLSTLGILFVLGSALAYTLYIITVNKTILKDVPSVKVTFYVILIGFIIFSVMVLLGGGLQTPTKWWLWLDLVAFALFPTVISMYCATKAIVYIGSTATAILGALEPVTAVLFGITLFGETLQGRGVAGLLLIIVSVTMVVAGGNISSALVRFKKLFPKLKK
ncbi:MAG: DMT family transporter [Bacteroidales bacterium]|nr:DMT family transporter [Bacteroidales bacterium]MBQ8645260.1 DMT family transporter [Bacteroidales bacterium]MBR1950849.1 DMT family transporter [Bacteroidales bacterium]